MPDPRKEIPVLDVDALEPEAIELFPPPRITFGQPSESPQPWERRPTRPLPVRTVHQRLGPSPKKAESFENCSKCWCRNFSKPGVFLEGVSRDMFLNRQPCPQKHKLGPLARPFKINPIEDQ